jgi:hypothetical protein
MFKNILITLLILIIFALGHSLYFLQNKTKKDYFQNIYQVLFLIISWLICLTCIFSMFFYIILYYSKVEDLIKESLTLTISFFSGFATLLSFIGLIYIFLENKNNEKLYKEIKSYQIQPDLRLTCIYTGIRKNANGYGGYFNVEFEIKNYGNFCTDFNIQTSAQNKNGFLIEIPNNFKNIIQKFESHENTPTFTVIFKFPENYGDNIDNGVDIDFLLCFTDAESVKKDIKWTLFINKGPNHNFTSNVVKTE